MQVKRSRWRKHKPFSEESIDAYLRDVSRYEVLAKEEAARITDRRGSVPGVKTFLESRNELIVHNLRLVIDIAKRYKGRGLGLDDLIQEGNKGLLRAAELFDCRKGTFSTCATKWIKNAILLGIGKMSRTIPVPIGIYRKSKQIQRFIRERRERTGETPSIPNIAKYFGISIEKVEDCLDIAILSVAQIDEICSEDEDDKQIEFGKLMIFADRSSPSQGELLVRRDISAETLLKLKTLEDTNKRNKQIFRDYYGLNENGIPKTLRELVNRHHLSRQAIQQIVKTVLKKLLSPEEKVRYRSKRLSR